MDNIDLTLEDYDLGTSQKNKRPNWHKKSSEEEAKIDPKGIGSV